MAALSPDDLKAARARKGWSQKMLAATAKDIAQRDGYHMAFTQQSIANFEGGRAKRVPSWLKYVAIALQPEVETVVRSDVAPLGIEDPNAAKFGEKPLAAIPLLGTAMAGEWNGPEGHVEMTELQLGEVLDHVRRPASLARDSNAYGVTIVGDSMWPRFRPGRRVIVSPRSPIAIGDDVIVQLLGADNGDGERRVVQVLIKELVRRSAGHVELRQFNPDVTFKVETKAIAAMHKVVGEIF